MTDQKPNYITVQIRAPRGDRDLGQVEEGWWVYDDSNNIVSLVTSSGAKRYDRKGKPLQAAVPAGETARKVAWRLTKDNVPKRNSGWNRKLRVFRSRKDLRVARLAIGGRHGRGWGEAREAPPQLRLLF